MKKLLFATSVSLIACTGAFAQDDCGTATGIADGAHVGLVTDTTLNTVSGIDPGCGGAAPFDTWLEWSPDADGTWRFSTCNMSGYDSRLALYSSCGGAAIFCNDDGVGCGTASVLDATGLLDANTYYLQIGGWEAEVGSALMDIFAYTPPTAPANNDCAGATPVVLGINAVSTDNATVSGLEPVPLPPWVDNDTPDTECFPAYGQDMNIDVWYTFVAGSNDIHQFSTCGTASYDNKLAIYSGACGAEVALACNDDGAGCPGFSSVLRATLTSGTSYLLQVGAWGTDSGTASMDVSTYIPPTPPANDDCPGATALVVGANAVSNLVSTPSGVLASGLPPYVDNDTPDTACQDFGGAGPDNLNDDVWHTFTPTGSGVWLFSTCNMNAYDTKLAIYSGSCGSEVALACNDDGSGCFLGSTLRATLTSGTQYLVQVGAFTGEGTATLDVSQEATPTLGISYCPLTANSAGAGTVMSATGTNSIAANDLVIVASNGPAAQPGVFFYGPAQIQVPFGEGNRCVGGAVIRLWPPSASAAGVNSRAVDYTSGAIAGGASPILVGSTMNFQYWHRDPAGGPSGFNLSDALEILFDV